jgi:hypothetical protein
MQMARKSVQMASNHCALATSLIKAVMALTCHTKSDYSMMAIKVIQFTVTKTSEAPASLLEA